MIQKGDIVVDFVDFILENLYEAIGIDIP